TALASVLLVRSQSKPVPRWAFPLLGAIAVAGVALVLSSPMGNNLTTEEARTTTSSRYTTFSQTLAASAEYFPVGSGVGTFQQVYRARENPADATTEYINHAHSDLIELLLETGLPGAILFILFLWWWIRRLFAIWRATEPDPFARAATIASAAVLAHSAVDYPLRTAAISALFALCLALMAEPRPKVRRSERSRDSARHLSAEED
ncbi:MAG: O-antigen ligase family protein, partial [Allosphingosinicella sp.]